MPGNRLYECENTVGTKTTYSKGSTDVEETYEGICRGQALAWVQNMLSGAQLKLTKPSYDKAAALQVLYERKSDGGNVGLFGKANLVVQANIAGNATRS